MDYIQYILVTTNSKLLEEQDFTSLRERKKPHTKKHKDKKNHLALLFAIEKQLRVFALLFSCTFFFFLFK